MIQCRLNPHQTAGMLSVSGFKVKQWMRNFISSWASLMKNEDYQIMFTLFYLFSSWTMYDNLHVLTDCSHWPLTDMIIVVTGGLSRVLQLGGHSHEVGSSLYRRHWHGTLAWVRGLLFQRTEVCMACRWSGKSTPTASQTGEIHRGWRVCLLSCWRNCVSCLAWYTGRGWRSSQSANWGMCCTLQA